MLWSQLTRGHVTFLPARMVLPGKTAQGLSTHTARGNISHFHVLLVAAFTHYHAKHPTLHYACKGGALAHEFRYGL